MSTRPEPPAQPVSSTTDQLLTAVRNLQHAVDNTRQAGDALRTTAGHVAQLNTMIQEHHHG